MSQKYKVYHYKKVLKQKAIDHLLWLNFINRTKADRHKLIETQRGDLMITHESFWQGGWGLYELRWIRKKRYRRMKYSRIASIAMDKEPLVHWESIRGMLSTQDGELLRFIIKYKIPLEKFIRYELASRGFDEDHQWCGFEKASEIWLK
ncbi:hypothetical protein N9954_08745 [Maribacter sp.]|nr:hypothetical protein [Maribacter sp.]